MSKSCAIMLAAIIMLLSLTACRFTNDEQPATDEIFAMNTNITQSVYGRDKQIAIEMVNELLMNYDSKWSLYNIDSYISQININAGKMPVSVDDATYHLIKRSTELSLMSQPQRRFDITIAPLTALWGITGDNRRVPEQSEITNALALVDCSKIVFDDKNKSVMLSQQNAAIDLGGVAKGYVCGEISEIYKSLDIDSAFVSLGGNIYSYGVKPDNSQYRFGIRDPLGTANDIMGILTSKDSVIATTGAYERYFEQDGKRYHHILDINSGYPCDSDLLSITVVSTDGMLADYLSTTLYINGTEGIEGFLNREEFSIIAIDTNRNVYISDSLKDEFEIVSEKYSYK